MKIRTLSQRSGIPVPTIKFYLREGLLPAGFPTKVNQAEYGDDHLYRLRLVQALSQVGGLSLAQVGAILALMQKPDFPVHDLLGETMLSPNRGPYTVEQFDEALLEVDAMISRWQWKVSPVSRARVAAAAIVATLTALGLEDATGALDRFAQHADNLAYEDDPAETPERGLIAAVIGDRLLIALRRLAEENVAATSGKEQP